MSSRDHGEHTTLSDACVSLFRFDGEKAQGWDRNLSGPTLARSLLRVVLDAGAGVQRVTQTVADVVD